MIDRLAESFDVLYKHSHWMNSAPSSFIHTSLQVFKTIRDESAMDKKKLARAKDKAKKEFNKYCVELVKDYERYDEILNFGCNDPFWSDGVNANLKCHHVTYNKSNLLRLHAVYGFKLPEEFFRDNPKEVSSDFMCRRKKVINIRGHKFLVYVNPRAYDISDKGGIINNWTVDLMNKKKRGEDSVSNKQH